MEVVAASPEATPSQIEEAMTACVRKVDGMLQSFTDAFPGPSSEGNFYVPGLNRSWTSGFWTGECYKVDDTHQLWPVYGPEGEDGSFPITGWDLR